MSQELALLLERISQARGPEEVFGQLLGDEVEQLRAARQIYRRLVKLTHPDKYATGDEAMAKEAFELLGAMWLVAKEAIAYGSYGVLTVEPTVTISTKRHQYRVGSVLASGDLADLYSGVCDGVNPVVVKVAREASENDLVKSEARVLKFLREPDKPEGRVFMPLLPELVETFEFREEGSLASRQVNVFAAAEGLYSLEAVSRAYPRRINPKDMAWMWRRLLYVLGYIHARGVIHGAVLPSHVLIHPPTHSLLLVDWCYAVQKTDGSEGHISAISMPYEAWYPPEVFAKQTPLPGTDILMSARCMVSLMGGDPVTGYLPETVPKRLSGFLQSCLLEMQSQRPQDAWVLLDEFTELIEQLWGPRTFRAFPMPKQ